jgi:hypothetical protein
MSRLIVTGLLALGMLIPAAAACAQSPRTMDQLYGQGVHAYYAGQWSEAMAALSLAVDQNSRDPRVFYFRGLTHNALGDLAAAEADFRIGASLEASPSGRFYPVGRALERVQGTVRMDIEVARRAARAAAHEQAMAAGPGASQGFIPVIPDPDSGANVPAQANFPDVSGVENPGTPLSQPIVVQIPQARPAGAEPPAATTNQPATGQTGQDPFGQNSREPRATDPDDPFAGSKAGTEKSGNDPFATEPPKSTEQAGDPFGNSNQNQEKPPAKSDDPFADDSKLDDKKDKDDGKKESPPDDPFGGKP